MYAVGLGLPPCQCVCMERQPLRLPCLFLVQPQGLACASSFGRGMGATQGGPCPRRRGSGVRCLWLARPQAGSRGHFPWA